MAPKKGASNEHNERHIMPDAQEGQGLFPHAHPSQIERDETMQHPGCILQILKRHYARYTPEVVEQICGVPQDLFLKIADTLVKNSGRERTTNLTYAVGWTQHTTGVQMIRTGGILQLLLGNMGRPGGGILPLLVRLGYKLVRKSTPRGLNAGLDLLVLIGGLILRYTWIVAGRTSADDPKAVHYYNEIEWNGRHH